MGGGIAFGVLSGWITSKALRNVNNYEVEVMITLALVMGGYSLAEVLGISGPIAMVVSGLFVGHSIHTKNIVSDKTESYVTKFWELIDVLFNALLFLLIGLEFISINFTKLGIIAGIVGVVIVFLADLSRLKYSFYY